MRRIGVSALLLSALCGSAYADPLQVTYYPYVASQPVQQVQQAQPVYVQAPTAQQYYVYAPQQGYAAPVQQRYIAPAPQTYAVTVQQNYAAPVRQTYVAPSAPAYTGSVQQTYAAPAPQTYVAPAPQTYAAAGPVPAPVVATAPASPNPGGGGFLQAIFGGPTIDVPVAHIYPGYQPPPQPQPMPAQVAPAPTQQAYATNPPDMSTYPINPRFLRQEVAYNGDEKPGTVIVDTPEKFLFLVEDGGKALRYGIGVGRPGFTWAGEKTITAMKKWPDWTPPPEMIERQPGLPRFMPGGLGNPLGARALYLGSTLYRIHGSNEPWTIGSNVSSGCIRMRNEDVEDLYDRVKVGTKVVVL
jgi:lipoprotein-anchoring transpeptidase ErfK/SrfK